jgi:hypothetical protein
VVNFRVYRAAQNNGAADEIKKYKQGDDRTEAAVGRAVTV